METTKSAINGNVHLCISVESSTKMVRVFNLLLQLGPAANQLRKQERGRSKLDSRSRRMETIISYTVNGVCESDKGRNVGVILWDKSVMTQ